MWVVHQLALAGGTVLARLLAQVEHLRKYFFFGEKIQIFAFEGIADFIARIMKVDLSGRKGYA